MRKITSAIFLIVLVYGCAHLPCNAWQKMEFAIPPEYSEQDYSNAKNKCLKKVDENNPGRCFVSGYVGLMIHEKVEREYQACMTVKGFPRREDDTANTGKY